MTEQRATLELIAAQLAEMLDLIGQMCADVRRIDEILQQALGRGDGGREAG